MIECVTRAFLDLEKFLTCVQPTQKRVEYERKLDNEAMSRLIDVGSSLGRGKDSEQSKILEEYWNSISTLEV